MPATSSWWVGGYYYLISVLDDYSRMIVGWRVQTSMSSADIIEVVQDAVEFTGQPTAPVEPGPALLSDNGPGFLSRALDEFLRARFMKHIFASPFHPQTNASWSGTIAQPRLRSTSLSTTAWKSL